MRRTTRRPLYRLLVTAIVVALFSAACGTSDPEVSTDPGGPSTEEPAATAVPDEPAPEPASDDGDIDVEPQAEPTEAAPEPTQPDLEPEATAQPEPEPTVDVGENQLPDVNVINIATGEQVNLRSFAPAENPIVLWFYAPH